MRDVIGILEVKLEVNFCFVMIFIDEILFVIVDVIGDEIES